MFSKLLIKLKGPKNTEKEVLISSLKSYKNRLIVFKYIRRYFFLSQHIMFCQGTCREARRSVIKSGREQVYSLLFQRKINCECSVNSVFCKWRYKVFFGRLSLCSPSVPVVDALPQSIAVKLVFRVLCGELQFLLPAFHFWCIENFYSEQCYELQLQNSVLNF